MRQTQRIPLPALRMALDSDPWGVHWPVEVDGQPGRALLLSAGASARLRLKASDGAVLSGQVALAPRDWRDCRGGMRAWVAAVMSGGARQELWSGELRTLTSGGGGGFQPFQTPLPAGCAMLELGCERSRGLRGDPPAERVMWRELELCVARGSGAAAGAAPAGAAPAGAAAAGPARPLRPEPGGLLFSVLMPVHDPPLRMLREAIESVRGQSYRRWELCIVDDGSRQPQVRALLESYAAQEPEAIRLIRREVAGGIAVATNEALRAARGEFVVLLDHDDTLEPEALALVAERLVEQPELDMIYSDEDIVSEEGERTAVHLKPAWAPDQLRAMMYTCHLGVYRRSLALAIGGFRSQYDGTQDYDFVLRLAERSTRVSHIPRVLYHWRAHTQSTAGGEQAKPYAYVLQPQAIAEHLDRAGVEASVHFGTFPGLHRVVHHLPAAAEVAVAVAVDEATEGWLAAMMESLQKQRHPTWRLILVGPASALQACEAVAARSLGDDRCQSVPSKAAGAAALAAATAAAGRADYVVLCEEPVLGLTNDWLSRIAGYASEPAVGAAGPVVLDESGRIRHAGVAVTAGLPLHLLHGAEAPAAVPVVFNLSALSGVLAMRGEVLADLGLQTELGQLALVDLCLRARSGGLRTVLVPDARVRACGPDRAVNDLDELWALQQRWSAEGRDPFYNPQYLQDRGDYALAPLGVS